VNDSRRIGDPRRIGSPGWVLLAPVLLAACASTPPDAPTCPDDAQVIESVNRFLARQPYPAPAATLTLEGAQCGARKFTAMLRESQGRVVGYKAGLTNSEMRERFGVDQPVRGTLFEKMMLRDGAQVPATFGAQPFLEADLVVEVGSAAINDATTPLEALAALRAIHPFIELPDLMAEDPAKLTGPAIVLGNVGARLGVLGAPVPVRVDAAFADALRDMTVRLADGTGRELESAKGSAILGHPLNAALWLAADLRRAGIELRPGDLLSLGSFSRGWPVRPGTAARVTYEGLPGNPSVEVRFQ
jgi:2-keto-4-pentenoate hydratase